MASKAMTKVDKTPQEPITIYLDKKCTKRSFFRCYETEILAFLYKSQVLIRSFDKTLQLQAQTFSELQIPPQYVQVEFNDTFAKISLLK